MSEQILPFNMHMHTHFSFNADGMSPKQIVEKAVKKNLYAIAICDFDVLDGLEPIYAEADAAGLRAAAGMETRVYFPEYGDKVINSPGEPGVYYFMGMGFGALPPADSIAGKTLAELRSRSRARNLDLVGRINKAFPEIALDYNKDVEPLTPSGNATERHVVVAYINKAREQAGGDATKEAAIWQPILSVSTEDALKLTGDKVGLQNKVRSALMKSGGVGYVQPDQKTFPPLEQVIEMILDGGAIPMATWLDGLSEGEADLKDQLECLKSKGVAAFNIIPDRNWNLSDPDLATKKISKLNEAVEIASSMDLPVNVGTELNSFGLPFVDNFHSDALKPHWPTFFKGAQIMVGQARYARYAAFSYCQKGATDAFGGTLAAKNDAFAQLGALPVPEAELRKQLEEMDAEKAFAFLRDAAAKGAWK